MLLSEVKVNITQWCPTLCDPTDDAVHGILQARILEWVAFPFSRRSSQPRDQTRSPAMQADSLPAEQPGKPKNTGMGSLSLLQGIFPIQDLNRALLHCRQVLYQLSYPRSPFLVNFQPMTDPYPAPWLKIPTFSSCYRTTPGFKRRSLFPIAIVL